MIVKSGKYYELPYHSYYYNNNNNNGKKKKKRQRQRQISYGIICVSNDGYIVINKSTPYIKTSMRKDNENIFQTTNFGQIKVNTNEKYNLMLSSFPNSTLEGEYTLPKGKIDDMDGRDFIFTKIREFIEETKNTHPLFRVILNKHYQDSNFISFLNDEKSILRECWLGLDNKIYKCEYSVFVVDSMRELFSVNDKNNDNTVPFDYFLNEFDVYRNCNKYKKKYKQSSKLDSQKITLFLPIEIGIDLLNQHKINLMKEYNSNYDSRIQSNDIYSIISSYSSSSFYYYLL